MSGGGGGGTTNTTATPWSGVQPFLSNYYQNAQNAWNNGQISPAQNTGQVVDWNASPDMSAANGQSWAANNTATSLATALANGNIYGSGNLGAQGLLNTAQGNFGNNAGSMLQAIAGGTAGTAGQGGSTLTNFAGGNFGNSILTSLAAGQLGANNPLTQYAAGNFNNPATSGLLATAQGANLDPNNPALQSEINAASQPLVQNFQQATLPSLLSTFSANGRLGSGANGMAINQASNALGQNLSNLSGTLTGNWMQNALQQQQSAQQTLAGLQSGAGQSILGAQQGAGNTLLGAQGNAAQSLLGGQIQAGSTLGNLASQANSNLASLQGNAVSALPGLGSANMSNAELYQNYLQSVLNSQIAQSNYNNMGPLMALQNMEGLLNPGQVNVSGQSSTTSQNPNLFGTTLGGAATGAAIGSVVPAVGTAIGAGVGGLAGLLGGIL